MQLQGVSPFLPSSCTAVSAIAACVTLPLNPRCLHAVLMHGAVPAASLCHPWACHRLRLVPRATSSIRRNIRNSPTQRIRRRKRIEDRAGSCTAIAALHVRRLKPAQGTSANFASISMHRMQQLPYHVFSETRPERIRAQQPFLYSLCIATGA